MNRRELYNSKARQSSTGVKRRKLNLSGEAEIINLEVIDSNNEIHAPKTKVERENERNLRFREELLEQSNTKANSKKKKRLDKYIEKKLKKEERILILDKLSKAQSELPTTLNLQSSSTLGTRRLATRQEQRDRLEDKDTRRAFDGTSKKRKRGVAADYLAADGLGRDNEDLGHDNRRLSEENAFLVKEGKAIPQNYSETVKSVVVGSALKRNPDGSVTMLAANSRGGKTKFQGWKRTKPETKTSTINEESRTDFDSSASENDSDHAKVFSRASEAVPKSVITTAEQNAGGFKNWALRQLSRAKGYVADPDACKNIQDSLPTTTLRSSVEPLRQKETLGPLGEDLVLPSNSLIDHLRVVGKEHPEIRKTRLIAVTRLEEVAKSRMLLPIIAEEQAITEAVLLNSVVIICGETGSGKTTQVPQFLYESGFGSLGTENCMIGITQPRRVAAVSMAARVAYELSLQSTRVSYQIRYDATVSPSTTIKFMTDGVLLRELATDFLLSKYSVIIIDEAHERSINTDILIGVLSRVIRLREEKWKAREKGSMPLRLVIMSATLRVSDFVENKNLFPSPPPVINVAARQFPVTVHFNRRTSSDYVGEAIKKVVKIHRRLPPGGILVFLTGQSEITGVCRKLGARFSREALDRKKRPPTLFKAEFEDVPTRVASKIADAEAEDLEFGSFSTEGIAPDMDEGAIDDTEALESDNEESYSTSDPEEDDLPMHIVPLYSLLPSELQMRVFQPTPSGTRLVVVSTNVAETSLTIPGIRYVVDAGRVKERSYNVSNGIQAFQVSWISKASAAQRAGRAGRTGPGHCYRLYSSALFEHYFPAFSQPEILRVPVESIVLQMKNFQTLGRAETLLSHLGALCSPSSANSLQTVDGRITELGKAMSLFPVSPRYSRMIVSGQQHGCLPYIISLVAALSVGDPFLREDSLNLGNEDPGKNDMLPFPLSATKVKEARGILRKAFFQSQALHASLGRSSSDLLKILSVVGAYEYAGGGHKFCEEHFVRPKAMEDIHKLRAQISNIVESNFPGSSSGFASNLSPPSQQQIKVIRQLLVAGFIDQVAIRKDRLSKHSSGVQHATSKSVPYRVAGVSEDVYIHPSSVLAYSPPPDFVVYTEIVRTSLTWLKGLTSVNPAWLSSLGKPSLCTFSKPLKNNVGDMIVIPKFGPEGWELPPIKAST